MPNDGQTSDCVSSPAQLARAVAADGRVCLTLTAPAGTLRVGATAMVVSDIWRDGAVRSVWQQTGWHSAGIALTDRLLQCKVDCSRLAGVLSLIIVLLSIVPS